MRWLWRRRFTRRCWLRPRTAIRWPSGSPSRSAPAIEGGVLLSLRGGDYELHVGQDLSVGYAAHDRQVVELYITESFTFRTLEPAAAVALLR